MPEITFRIRGRGVLPVLLLTGFIVGGCGDAGATITRLTVGTPGPDPYTMVSGTDRQKIKTSPRGGGTKSGNAPGLYGGTRQAATCDPAKLVDFLQANPDKARAWAKVHKLGAGDIPRFVRKLTPVLLRADTLVTNHGFKAGKAIAGPAVLQAGMGVLVNDYGLPVVKCNCGNPLTQPDKKISTGKAKYTGSSWPGFSKRKVTKVRDGSAVTAFVLVNPDGTMGFERPAATTGPADGPPTEVPPDELDSPSPGDSGSTDPSTSPDDSVPSGVPSDGTGSEPPGDGGTPDSGTPSPETPGEPDGTPDNGPGQQQTPDQEPNGDVSPPPPASLGPPEPRPETPVSS